MECLVPVFHGVVSGTPSMGAMAIVLGSTSNNRPELLSSQPVIVSRTVNVSGAPTRIVFRAQIVFRLCFKNGGYCCVVTRKEGVSVVQSESGWMCYIMGAGFNEN